MPFAWDVLTIKILWIGNLLYFSAFSIGLSGEGNFFYVIFYIAMAFPSSLLLIPWVRLIDSIIPIRGHAEQSSGNDLATTVAIFMVVLVKKKMGTDLFNVH